MAVQSLASTAKIAYGRAMTLNKTVSIRARYWIVLLGFLLCSPLWAEQWKLLGPNGGDARSLAYDPKDPAHIFLGTSTGSVFVSMDGGQVWSNFAHLGSGDDYVLDHILIDPKHTTTMFVSAWNVEDTKSGDVFRSLDEGKTWVPLPGMHDKSIRALAMAASDSKILVSGSLDGVYRSQDAGDSWQRISPLNHPELKNIESLAIDPQDPNIIYAGTWHLAWKTTDGGLTWRHINQGMVDDSDVFSIIVDPTNPANVYASACSGIYKSENAGELFHKIQGIPFSARRTRILRGDPSNPSVVYAGTTQGLWKTANAGKTWRQITNSEIVVNDVLVDPRNSSRLLLATDRGGVMQSDNGGLSFSSSNHGYTHRYVTAILADVRNPDTIFVGLANDREWGGVFSFRDRGSWQQKSAGLGGRDVFALKQTANGTLIAGTNHGIFVLDRDGHTWRPSNDIKVKKSPIQRAAKTKLLDPASVTEALMNARVNDIDIASNRWLVATSAGLFTSMDAGSTWNGGPVLGRSDFVSAHSAGSLLVAATHTEVLLSGDEGTNWQLARLPAQLSSIRGLTITPDAEVFIASREGAFRSSDSGKTWERISNGLPQTDLSFIAYDDSAKTLLATSLSTGVIFRSDDGGLSWQSGPDSGYPLRRITVAHGRLIAATPFDGVIVQQ
jgi:photosystem II stability/assembly factor-like uncharacterized protein